MTDLLGNKNTIANIGQIADKIKNISADMAKNQNAIGFAEAGIERQMNNPFSLILNSANRSLHPCLDPAMDAERVKLYEAIRDYLVAENAYHYYRIQILKEAL